MKRLFLRMFMFQYPPGNTVNNTAGSYPNRLIQLLMQIYCNHSQKQTGNELLKINYKDKLAEQY